jgi:hypothetical protein
VVLASFGNESAAQKATKAQKGYFDSLRNDVLNSNEELAYLNHPMLFVL